MERSIRSESEPDTRAICGSSAMLATEDQDGTVAGVRLPPTAVGPPPSPPRPADPCRHRATPQASALSRLDDHRDSMQ
jgi:hypothetical protein